MSQNWNDYLASQQIRIVDGRATTTRSSAEEARIATGKTILSPLTQLGTIRVSGADHLAFLQGQLSNDINRLDADNSLIAAYCNPKGRMLADFRIQQTSQGLLLHCHSDILEAVIKRLRMYVLMSAVTLEDVSATMPCIGIAGTDSEDLLLKEFPRLPSQENAAAHVDGIHILRLAGLPLRFMLCATTERITSLWQRLANSCMVVGTGYWELGDIYAGSPHVEAATVEAFIPQMLNLHAIDGISFTKGCYPGQEIVARMRYLGKLKRRMFRLHIDSEITPRVGDELISPSSQSAQGAGRLVTVATSPAGGYEALAVIEISSAETGDIALQGMPDANISVLSIPYDVPVEKDAS